MATDVRLWPRRGRTRPRVCRPSIDQARALAYAFVRHAAAEGYDLVLLPETPVVPDELFTRLTKRATLGGLEEMIDHWTRTGSDWVNLRFGIEDGATIIRYECRERGDPLDPGQTPSINGGFDLHRQIGQMAFLRRVGLGGEGDEP